MMMMNEPENVVFSPTLDPQIFEIVPYTSTPKYGTQKKNDLQ